jgi:hypothetical protein
MHVRDVYTTEPKRTVRTTVTLTRAQADKVLAIAATQGFYTLPSAIAHAVRLYIGNVRRVNGSRRKKEEPAF